MNAALIKREFKNKGEQEFLQEIFLLESKKFNIRVFLEKTTTPKHEIYPGQWSYVGCKEQYRVVDVGAIDYE